MSRELRRIIKEIAERNEYRRVRRKRNELSGVVRKKPKRIHAFPNAQQDIEILLRIIEKLTQEPDK